MSPNAKTPSSSHHHHHNVEQPLVRRVSFSSHITVTEIEKATNFTTNERNSTWYSVYELEKMKPSSKKIKKLASKKCSKECVRGLEFRTKDGQRRRIENYINAGLSVLDEQDLQRQERIRNADILSHVYHESSKHCAELAHKMALLDEKYVKNNIYCLPVNENLNDNNNNDDDEDDELASYNLCTCALAASIDETEVSTSRGWIPKKVTKVFAKSWKVGCA